MANYHYCKDCGILIITKNWRAPRCKPCERKFNFKYSNEGLRLDAKRKRELQIA